MRKVSKIVALLLVFAMVFSLAACTQKQNNTANNGSAEPQPLELQPEVDAAAFQTESNTIYSELLKDYASAFEAASAEKVDISKRYALQAIAEAKLLEAAVYVPTSSQGGMYAISRVAPGTALNALWGLDEYRFQYLLIVDGDPITSADRTEMKAKYTELKGTGTYYAWAKQFLADKGYKLSDSYNMGYSTDAKTWDILNTYRAADSEAIVGAVENLVRYDQENVMQPALAESWTVSDDGLTYTFKIRQGVVWVDSQGREVGKVTADSFVAGLQHCLDAQGGLEYLAGAAAACIVNADEYVGGEVTDFAQVGIKAVDDYTLQYTLSARTPYFLTILTYNPFSPLCREYYESMGGKFGAEFDGEAESYKYGKTPDSIAYCGAYLVKSLVEKNSVEYVANPTYWDAANVTIKNIKWLYNDGTDQLKGYNDMKAGTIAGCSLNPTALQQAKADGYFDKYVYTSATDATSYGIFMNVNRKWYANVNDATVAISTKTSTDAARTVAAMQNVHFRRAIAFSIDRAAYNAQTTSEDVKLLSVINSYVPGSFVQIPEDITVTGLGTFKAGTYYGEILQAQLKADGSPIKVWDPTAEGGLGSSAGFDGWYNPTEAVAELNKAIDDLKAQGIEVTAENPIYIDVPTPSAVPQYMAREQALKKSVEEALGGKVIVNIVDTTSLVNWYYSGYYVDSGYQGNYDMYDCSGWGPDYGDPQTYLNTLNGAGGDMIHMLGLFN